MYSSQRENITCHQYNQIYRVTNEALIAETAVWPNFFLMNVFFALKGSKLFILLYINDTLYQPASDLWDGGEMLVCLVQIISYTYERMKQNL